MRPFTRPGVELRRHPIAFVLREPREAWLTRAEVEAHLESRESSRRSILAHVWLLCVAGLGCGPGGDRAGADVSTLTVLYPGEERILGPYWDMPAKFLMFLPLVAYDEEGELEGRLAKRWEHSADYRTWTIHLRPDVLWHDGVPFTAQDVKYTLDMKKNPDVLAVAPDAYSVAVLDDSTLTITDNTGVGINPLDAWMVYYPRHLLKDLDPGELASWDFWTHPVGNGPYRYVRHVPKTMMEFEANPDYYAGRPRIDRLILKFGESSVAELLSGNVDVGGWVIPSEALKLAQDDRFRVYWEDSGTPRAILWKASHRLFRDVRVRRALTHAINRRELHQVLNLPEGPHRLRRALDGASIPTSRAASTLALRPRSRAKAAGRGRLGGCGRRRRAGAGREGVPVRAGRPRRGGGGGCLHPGPTAPRRHPGGSPHSGHQHAATPVESRRLRGDHRLRKQETGVRFLWRDVTPRVR